MLGPYLYYTEFKVDDNDKMKDVTKNIHKVGITGEPDIRESDL
jgi:hypothetical protein